MKVFLGGTCNGSDWRDRLIPELLVDYYNPVVEDWTPECQVEELKQRKECDVCIYVITPRMKGVYSIAEVVDDSNKRPEKTIFCFLLMDVTDKENIERFDEAQLKSLKAVGELVQRNGGTFCKTLCEVARIVNERQSIQDRAA